MLCWVLAHECGAVRCRAVQCAQMLCAQMRGALPRLARVQFYAMSGTSNRSHALPLPPARRSRKRLDANGQQRPDSEMLEINVRPGWKAGTKITFQEKGARSCAIFCCFA